MVGGEIPYGAKTNAYKQSRKDRKKIEMLFAHLKLILKLDRLRLRGLSGARDEFLRAATAQNLRRMAKLLSQPPPLQEITVSASRQITPINPFNPSSGTADGEKHKVQTLVLTSIALQTLSSQRVLQQNRPIFTCGSRLRQQSTGEGDGVSKFETSHCNPVGPNPTW
jgi:hypothetical protein